MARVFISYSREDEKFARKLARSLSELGADVWIDVEDIPAGMRWSSAIQQGLDVCQLMIVILSPDSTASRNVEDEWQYYLDQGKPIVPVLLRQTKVHYQLSRIQYVNFLRQGYEGAFQQLHAELLRQGLNLALDTDEIRALPMDEEPLPIHNWDGMATIRTRSPVLSARLNAARSAVVEAPEAVVTLPMRGTLDPTRPSADMVQAASPHRARSRVGGMAALAMAALVVGLLAVSGERLAGLLNGSVIAPVQTAVNTPPPNVEPTSIPFTRSERFVTVINATQVSLRRGPSASYQRVSVAVQGSKLHVIGQDPSSTWYLVVTENQDVVWISSFYADLAPEDRDLPVVRQTSSLLTEEPLVARTEPNLESASIDSVAQDTVLPIIAQVTNSSTWYQVLLPSGREGWVPASSS